MNHRTLAALWLAAVLVAGSAAAQTSTDTRAAAAASARDEKADANTVVQKDPVERLLDLVERNSLLQFSNPRDGFGVRTGGIENGSGLAAGPMWRSSTLLRGRVHVHASSAFSIARDRELEGGVAIPDFRTGRLTLGVGAAATHLAQERFYGQGGSSSLANETTFALDRRESGARLIVTGTPWFRVAAGVGMAALSVANGIAVGVPGIFTRWTTEEVPTLNAAATYAIASLSVTADRRDVSGNPRRGGRYSIRLDRHADRSHNRYSFNRLNIDLEQHIPWWKNQRLLTLRGTAVFSQPDAGHRVPFYLEPTLGGSSLLRGFVPDRFRDRHLIALQAEYAYDIWPFLNAVLFYESGAVAHDWHQISLKDLKRDYGIGFRVGSARTVGVRTDVAFGSGEGTRITMRFSHAF